LQPTSEPLYGRLRRRIYLTRLQLNALASDMTELRWHVRRRRPLLGLIGVLVTVPAGACDGCENEVVSAERAPGGQRVAVIFGRSCGATTGFSTQVSLLQPSELPLEPGNVLVIDDNTGHVPTGPTRGPAVRARWLAGDHLELRYSGRARVFRAAESVHGVRVTHVRDST
jgi:hypothetical protein